ncbi:hypothetical protein VP448O511_P0013 [Vibrio phage 448O51-1]|nr:hypothetical protein VP448O511_P0013 [Vibrio phage 448O51-1]
MSARFIRYTLDGVKLTHDIGFGVTDDDGFDVYVNRAKLDKGLDYDVIGSVEELREGGGKITLKTAHAASDVLLILSDTLARRVTNFAKAARFEEEEIDNEFDNLLRLLEDAALNLQSTPYFDPVDIGLVDGKLPPIIAEGILRVNALGNGFELIKLDEIDELQDLIKLASDEADRSKDEADRSKDEADKSKDEADKSKDEADKSKSSADRAKAIAESIEGNPTGNYKGLWPSPDGNAKKGETWQTQVGGKPSGQYFTALKDTAVSPAGDDVNWRAIVSGTSIAQYTDIVYKSSGGNSAVENMVIDFAANPIMHAVGSVIKTGGTTWEYIDSTGSITLENFRAFNAACVLDFGATGKGLVSDHVAFQKAINTKLSVYVPTPDVCYLMTDSLVLNGGQKMIGDSKSDGVSRDSNPLRKGVYGDMVVNGTPLIIMGDGSDASKRLMSFYDLYLFNNNGPVVKSRSCAEFSFYSCTLKSRFYHAIDTQQTYLSSFYNCKIDCSGTVNNDGVTPSYAIMAMDNSNGLLFSNCRITGGSAGGVADIGRSYTITFDTCVFETTKLGIRAAGNPDALVGGNVTGLNLKNCQFENAGQCLDLGSHYSVKSVTISGGLYITHPVGYGVPITDAAIVLGRVTGLNADVLTVFLDDNQYLFRFDYNSVAAGQGSVAYLNKSSIPKVIYDRITPDYEYTTSRFPVQDSLSALAENNIELSELVGGEHSYTTDTIVCSDGIGIFKITPIKDFGAKIRRVEIIEASGNLNGTLQIGTSVAINSNMNLDLSTISFLYGYADITSSVISDRVRATKGMLYRVIAGSASTKFRVRITYNS